MLVFHILIALSSIAYTGLTYLSPSAKKLKISYVLVVATFITGTYLVVLKPSHMVSSCITGLFYLGIISVGIYSAHHKLLKNKID